VFPDQDGEPGLSSLPERVRLPWKRERATTIPLCARSFVSLVNISLAIGEKMQGNARDLLGVTREAGRADEQQARFQSRGNSTVEHSVRVLVPCKDVVFSDWRPARKYRQHRHPAVVFLRSRANPAPCIPGAAA